MKRFFLSLVLIQACLCSAYADHITGGEIFYTYASGNNGKLVYNVTVRLFMRCNSGRLFNNPTIVSIFNTETGARINDYNVTLDRIETISMVHDDPCITNPPTVCYEVGYYHFQAVVPEAQPLTVTAHVNFRIDGINNLMPSYDRVGATYIGEIPATLSGNPGNNSAHFIGEDLVVVCAENTFTYSFGAEDADGDVLRYSFCNAYRTDGLAGGFGNNMTPPTAPPYQSVPYGNGFSGNEPLGNLVKIDAQTGLITGIAPARGVYVVTVCVDEIRNGVVIATQHKDLQIFIAPCSITAAALPDEYMLCDSTQTLTTKNNSTSPLINSYNWEFLSANGTKIFESSLSEPSFTFADTGLYTIKLFINKGQQCSDSTTAVARVYPGFEPNFDIAHPCISTPAEFTDRTTSALGTVNMWDWDFGEPQASTDFSADQNPVYGYTSIGNKQIRLVVQDTKGCKDTLTKIVNIFDKPPISLAFRDTLICPPDDLRLSAEGDGIFSWTGGALNDIASPFATVSPTQNTVYYVNLDSDGCTNRDSVSVRVVNNVSLQAMNDATICLGDTVGLVLNSNGLKYQWSPALSLDNGTKQNPVARPTETTTYSVTATISSCVSTGNIVITTVPYPVANAGLDTTICFNTQAQLNAFTDGSSFNWSPSTQLSGSGTLNPVAAPFGTTQYLLYAYDTKGCPKPGIDTVVVTVMPDINAYAGRDTIVVTGQPLQLQASGGVNYKWMPSFALSDIDIANPVAMFNATPSEGYHQYKVLVSDENGCTDSAYVQVRIFASGPELYVPTAFTPNSDGKNDFFQLIAAGIRNIELFRVYNRWGQVVFDSPGSHSRGWDGLVGGRQQAPDTYVWVVKAIDYTGKPILKKGTVVLIR